MSATLELEIAERPPDERRPEHAEERARAGNPVRQRTRTEESTPQGSAWQVGVPESLIVGVYAWRIAQPLAPLPRWLQLALCACWRRA